MGPHHIRTLIVVHSYLTECRTEQENPPAWLQEAYCLLHILSVSCAVRGGEVRGGGEGEGGGIGVGRGYSLSWSWLGYSCLPPYWGTPSHAPAPSPSQDKDRGYPLPRPEPGQEYSQKKELGSEAGEGTWDQRLGYLCPVDRQNHSGGFSCSVLHSIR